MTQDLHRPMIVVELDIEERFGIRTPHHGAVGFLDGVVTVDATSPIAHPDREIFRALDIGAPGFKPMIRRMPGTAELEISVVPRQLVAVQNVFPLPPVARRAP